jgi:hypothetical protein
MKSEFRGVLIATVVLASFGVGANEPRLRVDPRAARLVDTLTGQRTADQFHDLVPLQGTEYALGKRGTQRTLIDLKTGEKREVETTYRSGKDYFFFGSGKQSRVFDPESGRVVPSAEVPAPRKAGGYVDEKGKLSIQTRDED